MDRKGWIILILCGIGFALTYRGMQTNNENQRKIAEQQRLLDEKAKPEAAEAGDTVAEGDTEADEVDTPAVETPEKLKEKLYTLTTRDEAGEVVEYTFTNKGGGVKLAKMLTASKGPEGEEVILNQFHKQPIGALAEDEGDFANITYPSDAVKQTESTITFKKRLKSGLAIVKTWSLEEDDVTSHSHRLKLQMSMQNFGDEPIKLKDYAVTTGIAAPLFEDERPDLSKWFFYQDGSYDSGGSGPFTDGWFGFSKARETDPHAVQNLEYAGVSNQFYTTILIPESETKRIWIDDVTLKLSDDGEELRSYVVGVQLPDHDLIKGSGAQTYTYKFYTGPRKQSEVSKLTKHSSKTMSYGWFGFGAPWANIFLNWIHDTMGIRIHEPWSWGFAIVILTIFVRIAIWPLTNKATRTMKRMGKLAPLMKEIREKNGDNPQKVQQETMKLYRKYKVNPFGGCLPMLIQMPIFFAVFGMLTNAVELRGQGFLWVQDLSQQEAIWMIPYINLPLNILPITMAVTMVFQMRMTPSTADKLQRRIFMLMPLIFFVFCYSFASALALYWTVQNIISIGQTWLVQRMPEPELVEADAGDDGNTPRKKGFMEKMAEKLEDAQKQRETAIAAKTGKPAPKPKAQPKVPGQKTEKEKKPKPKTGGK